MKILKKTMLFYCGFYNKEVLINVIIFIIVVYFFAILASQYAMKYELLEKQQQNRETLSSLKNFYENKHDNFADVIYPLFGQGANNGVIRQLTDAKNEGEYLNGHYFRQKAVAIFMEVAVRDQDIQGIIFYKMFNRKSYVFDRNKQTFEETFYHYPYELQLSDKTIKRNSYETNQFMTYINRRIKAKRVYAIAGTFGVGASKVEITSFAVMYDVNAFDVIMDKYSNQGKGRFLITNYEGGIIYDTDEQYEEKFPYINAVLAGDEKIVIDNENFYVQSIKVDARQYVAVHLISKKEIELNKSPFSRYIFVAFTAIAIVYVMLFMISSKLVTKKVKSVIKGIHKISINNLSYRIPVNMNSKNKDEFQEISIKFNEMCDQLQSTIELEYINEIKKKNAELLALQSWINPHFLYNTLESIRIKALDDGNVDISEMIVLLANLFRNIVKEDQVIPIYKELNICQMYLEILLLRYSDKFVYDIDISNNILIYGIPKNILQPLIENYFVHGIRKDSDDNKFSIDVNIVNEDIVFILEDNGIGIDMDTLIALREQLSGMKGVGKADYGLYNVHERIRLIYGKGYGISIKSDENEGTQVILRIKALTCEEIKKQLNK